MALEEGTITKPRTKTKTNLNENNNNNFHLHGKSLRKPKSLQFSKIVSNVVDWRLILILILITSFFLVLSYFSSYGGESIDNLSNMFFQPRKTDITQSRIAVCLVGGARRFELTGPSIIDRVLTEFPNSDLFLNSPIDSNSFKLSLLKFAPRVKWVRIFKPQPIPESLSQLRVLTAANSPNGIQIDRILNSACPVNVIPFARMVYHSFTLMGCLNLFQGLLQYFNLVEGCITMIDVYQKEKGFTYDWIVRTRVDSYWSDSLRTDSFVPGEYVIPPGSSYGGLNDQLGVGDYNTSVVARSRLSLIPTLDKLNYTELNSETAFKAQLDSHNISFRVLPQPFCIVTERKYLFPPGHFGVPVAALSSRGPLSGIKCRPCTPACAGSCVDNVMSQLTQEWNWAPLRNDTVQLCDAHSEWELGWEQVFDEAVGERLTQFRKTIKSLDVEQCVKDFMQLKSRAEKWDTLPLKEICKLGLEKKQRTGILYLWYK